MELTNAINKFHFELITLELRLMNKNTKYPNISYNSLLYLDIIAYKGTCTVSYLSRILHVAKPAVTMKVNELMQQGFLEKIQSTEDKRVNYLSVKQEVLDNYKFYDAGLAFAVDIIKEKYSEKEIQAFCEMLSQISSSYTKEMDCGERPREKV